MTQDNAIAAVEQAQSLLRQLASAKDGETLKKLVAENIMACDGVFFAELEALVAEFQRRGDETSARKLKELGDFMARLRFMI